MNVTDTINTLRENPEAPVRLVGPAREGTYMSAKTPTPHRIGESRYVYTHASTTEPSAAGDIADVLNDSLHRFTWMTNDVANGDYVNVWVNLPNGEHGNRWHVAAIDYTGSEYVARLTDW